MAITAELADGRKLEFPDGTDPAVIQRTVKNVIGGQKPPLEQIDVNGPQKESMGPVEALGGLAMGGLKGASRIGNTIVGTVMGDRKEREKSIDQFMNENADTDSTLFKVGDIGAQIAGTAGAPGAIAKGVSAIPQLAKFAPAIQSGGFNLGAAKTTNPLANALMRAGGAGVGGAAATAMVSPEDTGTGALISAATPLAVQGAAKVGQAIGSGLRSGSESLMQSALKPTIEQLRTGKAGVAVRTLLDEGINPTAAGVEKLQGRVGDINSQIDNLIQGSNGVVDKNQVISALNGTIKRFTNQVSPKGDLDTIAKVIDDFVAHPTATGNDIPVQLAQELKKGTYRVLKDKAYGQVGSADMEAQKALARGLKEGISKAVPEVAGLNAQEAKLLTTLKVTERRALMDANKNPMGLAILASNPASWAAFMADRSAAFKGLAARLANNASKAANSAKALENFAPPQALITAPAVAGAGLSARE